MTVFTEATLLAFIAAHNCVSPQLAPVMVGVCSYESGLNSAKVHANPNGTRDYGLCQVNDVNLRWTGLTDRTALDPCLNIAAGAKVLLAKYNGNPPDLGKIKYADGVTARIRGIDKKSIDEPMPLPPDPPVIFLRPSHSRRLVYSTN